MYSVHVLVKGKMQGIYETEKLYKAYTIACRKAYKPIKVGVPLKVYLYNDVKKIFVIENFVMQWL